MNWRETLDFLERLLFSLGGKILGALVVLAVGFKLIKVLKNKLKKSERIIKLEDGVESFCLD